MKYKNVIIVLFFLTSISPCLVARDFNITVLPLLIKGKPEYTGLDLQKAPNLLREASKFLLQQAREIRVWNPSNFKILLGQSKYNHKKPFQKDNLIRICNASNSWYIMSGSAFFSKRNVEFDLRVYSCKFNQFMGHGVVKTNYSDFQQGLRRSIIKSTPFINPIRKVDLPSTGSQMSAIDLAVVLDASGSMNSDFPTIIESLKSLQHTLPNGSRLGLVIMKENSKQEILPFTKNWATSTRILSQIRPAGKTKMQDLLSALKVVERYNNWIASKKLLVFSDQNFSSRRQSYLESALRRIAQNGIQTSIFPLANQNYTGRREWKRISRAIKLNYANVIYGKRIYTLGQRPYFLILAKDRFYTGRFAENLEPQIKSGNLDFKSLLPVPTTSFLQSELTLDRLATSYPRLMNQKVSTVEPVVSNLGKAISKIASKKKNNKSGYKILVKNNANSFWLPIQHPGVIKKIKNMQKKSFYIGLHLSKREKLISTIAHPVYIRNYATVPRLFLTSWTHLHKISLNKINVKDIWFLKVTLIEIKKE